MFQKHTWKQGKDQPQCTVVLIINFNTFFSWLDSPSGPKFPHSWGFEITLKHTKHGRTPLNEWLACWRDLYLHKRQHSQKTDLHAPDRIRTCNSSKRAAVDPLFRPQAPKLSATMYPRMIYLQEWFREIIHDGLNHWQLSHKSNFTSSHLAPLIYSANKNLFLRFI